MAVIVHAGIRPGLIGVDLQTWLDSIPNEALQRRLVGMLDNSRSNHFRFPVPKASNRRLANGAPAGVGQFPALGVAHVAAFAANVGLIEFDRTDEQPILGRERFRQPVRHESGRF